MSIDNAIRKRDELLTSLGKRALNVRYPKEFELYVCALELVDQDFKTLRYFVFPIMPSAINETEPEAVNIKRTQAGITVLNTTTFVPVDINLSGNFGRKFKILLGSTYQDFVSSFRAENGKITKDSAAKGLENLFDERVKTGFGCLQVLKEILDESKVVDEKGARTLIYYNPSFGTSYIVKVMSKKIDMTQDQNMFHNYYISLKAVAPLDALKSQKELESDSAKLNTTAYIQKQTDRLVNGITSILI